MLLSFVCTFMFVIENLDKTTKNKKSLCHHFYAADILYILILGLLFNNQKDTPKNLKHCLILGLSFNDQKDVPKNTMHCQLLGYYGFGVSIYQIDTN